MARPRITIAMKDLFFDREAIKQSLDKARHRVLNRQGALVRAIARRSIRRVKNPARSSPPGTPPRAHDPGKNARFKMILYIYDAPNDVVIVGLPYLERKGGTAGMTVPEIHEFGGTYRGLIPNKTYRGRKNTSRQNKGLKRLLGKNNQNVWLERRTPKFVRGMARFPKRPYMRPALEKAAPKFPQMWKDTIY